MRYGLISNPWRNWGPVGERVPIPKQMAFQWGYLWAEIDVLAGEVNVWLLPEMNGVTLSRIVARMPEEWGNNVALVWDNAGAHKSAAKHLPDGMSVISLPAYSLQPGTESCGAFLPGVTSQYSQQDIQFSGGTRGRFGKGIGEVFPGQRGSQETMRISLDT